MIYEWAVIGAGPAGIAAVGKLLDQGISSAEILWIDLAFKVGDFGARWANVPSNTKVDLFNRFLQTVKSFEYLSAEKNFPLYHAEKNKTCYLSLMVEPLQWVTNKLKEKVQTIEDQAETLTLNNRSWRIQLKKSECRAKNVILATGADPKNLAISTVPIIPLQDAMDAGRIKQHIQNSETIAVFGSSHSAILALRNLVENGAKRILNFYRSPLLYAIYLEDAILFDDTGLKGPTAEWAHDFIDGKLPASLERIYSTEENVEHYLPQCDKVVYAIGFERRQLPVVEGVGHLNYIEECGIIAPGLFGFGIAYPEAKENFIGRKEYRVGLWKFMDYLQRVLPIWLKYPA